MSDTLTEYLDQMEEHARPGDDGWWNTEIPQLCKMLRVATGTLRVIGSGAEPGDVHERCAYKVLAKLDRMAKEASQ